MFLLPLDHQNTLRRTPVVTHAIITLCILLFLWQVVIGEDQFYLYERALGVVPARLFGDFDLPPEWDLVPAWATVVTSTFLHADFDHLAGNMLFLKIFGDDVEDRMGRGRFVPFFLLCGVAGKLAQAGIHSASELPMAGASSAISGVLGAYLVFYPRAKIRTVLWFIAITRLVNVPVALLLGGWIVLNILLGFVLFDRDGGIAYWAHVGGFVAGAVLGPLFLQRGALLVAPDGRAFDAPPLAAPRRHGSVPAAGSRRWP